ncbi:MAG: hypothetical protein KF729_01825 [Sandaracinaceae bacterium]|nr:hypothetical protein [Sandaracinaceae bacterium]
MILAIVFVASVVVFAAALYFATLGGSRGPSPRRYDKYGGGDLGGWGSSEPKPHGGSKWSTSYGGPKWSSGGSSKPSSYGGGSKPSSFGGPKWSSGGGKSAKGGGAKSKW